jgi:hypothetical protein
MIPFASVLAQIGSGFGAVTQPALPSAVDIVMLPSDRLERARPRILLTSFISHPGPQLEALMRSAAFQATEHKYDL